MSGSSGRIPESFIADLLSKVDIVSLIQDTVKLKREGANYSGCCPFHQEKTPSFKVNHIKQFYHCFGCGANGDAIRFLMDNASLNFVDAVEQLAMRVGLIVPKDAHLSQKTQIKHRAASVLSRVSEFYVDQLKRHSESKAAVAYLKKRGVTGLIAKIYSLGFAPSGWDNLLRHFHGDDEALKLLEESGLIIKHQNGHFYDRFRERIMFPIRDRRGEVIGFGARVINQGQPKYLNSSESPFFQKSHCLYGIYEAISFKEKWETAIVVEGYMDVVALAQHGIKGVIATLGTALSHHHLTSLFQRVPEIIFCFDGDKAGKRAAWKALQLVMSLLTEGRQVKFVFLPEKDDPDSYIRQHGQQIFMNLVRNAMPLSTYFFHTLSEKISLQSVDGRAQLASLARPLIEMIPKGIFKEMMFEQLAKLVASSPQVVRGEKAYRRFFPSSNNTKPKLIPPPQPIEPAYIASALLLRKPILIEMMQEKDFDSYPIITPGMDLFKRLDHLLKTTPTLSREALKHQLEAQGLDLTRLYACENKILLIPEEGLEAEFLGAITRLEFIGKEQYAEELLQKAKNKELSTEEKTKLMEFLQSRESIN